MEVGFVGLTKSGGAHRQSRRMVLSISKNDTYQGDRNIPTTRADD